MVQVMENEVLHRVAVSSIDLLGAAGTANDIRAKEAGYANGGQKCKREMGQVAAREKECYKRIHKQPNGPEDRNEPWRRSGKSVHQQWLKECEQQATE